jgi:hypothetical protein
MLSMQWGAAHVVRLRFQAWDDHKEVRRSWPRAAARVREESRTARTWSVSGVVNEL